jgi:glucosylceramidase
VRPGARWLETVSWTGYENRLAFANPDGSTVVVLRSDLAEPLPVRIAIGGTVVAPMLPADSWSRLVWARGETAPRARRAVPVAPAAC